MKRGTAYNADPSSFDSVSAGNLSMNASSPDSVLGLGLAVALIVLVMGTVKSRGADASRDRRVPEGLLLVQPGDLPIVLCVPHGGRARIPDVPARTGHGVARFATTRDDGTDALARAVSAELEKRLGAKPYLIVARAHRRYVDVNRPPADGYESELAKPLYDAYHEAIRLACQQIRRRGGRGLLLDLHGQSAEAEVIFRGTNNGKAVERLRRELGETAFTGPQSLLGQLEQKGYRVVPPCRPGPREDRRFNGGFTVQNHGSHRTEGLDAIQLEFGSQLRSRERLARTAADVAMALQAFARKHMPVGGGLLRKSAGSPVTKGLHGSETGDTRIEKRARENAGSEP
jgi:N-formylglutamate amidohydrolase